MESKISRGRLFIREMQTLIGIYLWKLYFFVYKGNRNDKLFLVVPINSDMELYYLLLYFDKLLEKKQQIILITEDMRVYDWLKEISVKEFRRKRVTKRKMRILLYAFPYIQFQNQLIIASISQPTGRQGLHMLGKDGITLNELFSVGVLKIKNGYYNSLLRPDRIDYHGTNKELMDFIIKRESEISEFT